MSGKATWAERNREHRNYLSARTSARSFIRNKATNSDLDELKEIIAKKEAEHESKNGKTTNRNQ